MSWSSKYWDAVTQFYWEPGYLGLISIPKSRWGSEPGVVSFSKTLINNGGSIYTRQGSSKKNLAQLKTFEETLNHIFDITFSIAPDEVIAECFGKPLEIEDSGPFKSLGREVKDRYCWGNVTQQDGYFISTRSAIGVELKLSAPTTPIQVLKYLALMVQEQKISLPKGWLGLLYITPQQDPASLWKQCGATVDGRLPDDWLHQFKGAELNPTLRNLLDTYPHDFSDAARRIQLAHVSWQKLAGVCRIIMSRLSLGCGDQTLTRLLSGFVEAIENHEGTQVQSPSANLRMLSILESIRRDMDEGPSTIHLKRLERALGCRVEELETPKGDALQHVLSRFGVWAEHLKEALQPGEVSTAEVVQLLDHLGKCQDLSSLSCSE